MENNSNVEKESNINTEKFDFNHMLALMAIYRDEWMHRDRELTSITFRYGFISLAVTFLPNIATEFNFSQIPLFQKLPIWVFSAAGICCSLFAMYIALAIAKRIEFIDNAYKRIMNDLPEDYKIKPIREDSKRRNRIYRFRLNAPFSIIIFSVVIFLAIANIFWTVAVMP